MPGKSRRSRTGRSARSKRRGGTLAKVAREQVAARTYEPAAPPVPVSSPGVPAPKATLTGARYSYVVTELRRIGVLAGVMLTILVILSLVLP